ncbi:ribosome maturation factor RimM [Hydrogenovibrio sp. JE_KL2]|uniref:ribosome maturation factor RimM n=1 Tax=Hydrogenovibrio sp. JE_KL2 TaxID=2651188 RepID=UPI00128DCEFE|nr:ribosome maturation factor RimM [Hydrogenovibrio sp. JE_KL2]MPQ77086.1 ribosome maturation factor RimM [Hydrogenovibrio sp. JE_KL2]
MSVADGEKLILGKISGIFGVKGWLKIFSHTEPRDNILSYSPWLIKVKGEWRTFDLEDGQEIQGGKGIVAKLEGIDDRDEARLYMGCEIAINPEQLPEAEDGYYWRELIGCSVTDQEDNDLGVVTALIETGAHDVLRVEKEGHSTLIPFVEGTFILDVDVENKHIQVAWDGSEE